MPDDEGFAQNPLLVAHWLPLLLLRCRASKLCPVSCFGIPLPTGAVFKGHPNLEV